MKTTHTQTHTCAIDPNAHCTRLIPTTATAELFKRLQKLVMCAMLEYEMWFLRSEPKQKENNEEILVRESLSANIQILFFFVQISFIENMDKMLAFEKRQTTKNNSSAKEAGVVFGSFYF